MWHQGFNRNFMKLPEYFLYAKKTKITTLSMWCGWHRRVYAVCVQRIFSKMVLRWCRGDELLNKIVIFVFFTSCYSRSFVKLWLNPWCHMDYFTDVLATFLDVDRVYYIAVYGRVRELSECIKNILICVPKTNKAFTGLERHGGKWLMTKFSFWGGVTL